LSGRDSTPLAAFVVLVGLTAWIVFGVATDGDRGGIPDHGGSESAIGTTSEGRDRGGDAAEFGETGSGALIEERSDTGSSAGPGVAPTDPESGTRGTEATGSVALGEGSGSLVVVVEDRSGSPLAGVRVALRSLHASRELVTAGPGKARFSDLPAGSYEYVVQPPGGPELVSEAPFALGRDEERTLVLRLGGYDLAISGRVLNQSGEPVPDIELVAQNRLRKAHVASPGALQSKARSNADGSFAIRGLEEGDYEVRTAETDRYVSVAVSFRAGIDSADIVLVDRRKGGVYGTVTSSSGEPLRDVQVVPLRQSPRATATDEGGGYELFLDFLPSKDRTEKLRFRLSGYRQAERMLSAKDLETVASLRLDIELEPVGDTVDVSGTVRTEDGRSVEGETIHLHSRALATRYREVSDAEGRFFVSDVQVGSDYRIFVLPRGKYRDYVRTPVALTRDSPPLDLVLEHLATGRLEGRMIDAEGKPVPRFRLWLWSRAAQRKSSEVSGDDGGYFVVEDVAAGPLAFKTMALPDLRVGWIELDPGERKEVLLVVDWGEHWIAGRVVDERREPVSGAELQLSWSSGAGGLDSQSKRESVSDRAGFFRFDQLGPGPHLLEVRADGYASVRESLDVGREFELQLRRSSP
jgi:protocatechuate 3,4-dioxygenase beta subunit